MPLNVSADRSSIRRPNSSFHILIHVRAHLPAQDVILPKVIFQALPVADLPGYQFQDPCPPLMRKVRICKSLDWR